jgi:hypothetical protein
MAEDRGTGPRENTSPETDAVSLPQYDMLQNDIGLPDEDHLGGFATATPDSTQTLDPDLYDESPPAYEEALTRMEGFVQEEFGEDVARAVTRPNQAMDALPDSLDLNEVYQAVEPMLAEDADAMMAGEQYRTQWKNMGRNPDELDNTMLRQMAAFWGEQATGAVGDAAAGMAEARSRWGKLKDTIVDVGVSVFTSPDFNVGLQTLDFFTWANKKFKLAFVPREERAEIEQRVLPRVTLKDGTEYTVATGFAIQQMGQNLLAGAEGIGGGLVETIGGWVGSETMEDIGRRTRERGGQRRETYEDRVQEAASLMGDHLTWIQVGEMRDPGMVVDIARALSDISLEPARPGLAAPEEADAGQISDEAWNRVRDEVREADSIDPLLAEMHLQGETGYGVLGALAFGDALMEIAFDPTVIAGEAAPKVLPAIRAGVKAADPARAARITSKVARDTERLEDTADAINAARAHVRGTQDRATAEIRRTGSVSKETRDKVVLAQRQLANEEAYLGRAKDPGPNDVVIPYSRRTHPDVADMDLQTTEKYVGERVSDPDALNRQRTKAVRGLSDYRNKANRLLNRLARASKDNPASSILSQMRETRARMQSTLSRLTEARKAGEIPDVPPGLLVRLGEVQQEINLLRNVGADEISTRVAAVREKWNDLSTEIGALERLGTDKSYTKAANDLLFEATETVADDVAPRARQLLDNMKKSSPERAARLEPVVDEVDKILNRLDAFEEAAFNTLTPAQKSNMLRDLDRQLVEAVDKLSGIPEARRALGRGLTRIKDISERLTALDKGPVEVLSKFEEVTETVHTRARPKTVDELAAELHDTRVRELGRDADYVLPDQAEGLPLFESARVLGADDIEQAGDALNHAVRTGGTGINDIWLHAPVPHHNITPDTNFGLIDWKALDRANDVTRAERQFMATSGATQFDLGYSVRRSLHRQKAIVDKNYGLARQSGDKARIKVYEKQKENIENAIRAVKDDKTLRAADKKFDERWRPGVTDKPMGNPESFHRRLQTFGDQLFETAYPGGWAIRGLQRSKLGQMFIPFREPQRFFETFRPQVWDEMQGGYIRYQSNNRAWHEGLRVGAEKSGIYRPRSKWDPRRAVSRYEVDEAKNELLFDLLDTDPDGNPERFAELAARADDALMKFHDDIRRQLDYYADLQGIGRGPGSPRYLRGYMRHTVTPDQFAGGARPIEYIGVPRNADIFTSHLMHRKGPTNYRKDALAVLDLYGRAANRKIHLEPLFDSILQHGKEMADEFSNPLMLQYANDLVSELSGKPTPFMHRLEQAMGWAAKKVVPNIGKVERKDGTTRRGIVLGGRTWQPGTIDRTLTGLVGLLWAGTLPGNPRYPVMSIATGIATTGSRFGLFRTTRGMFQQATREGQAAARAAGTYDEFLNIFESDKMRRFSQLMAERGYTFSPFGVMSTGMAEEFIRGMTFHASVDMHMTKLGISSWDEAVEMGLANRIAFEALRSSQEVNHVFGAMGRSPMMSRLMPSRSVATATTQFLSFIPKQTEELLSQMNRNPGYLVEYMALSGMQARIAAQAFGIDISDYTGFGYAPTQPVEDLRSPAIDGVVEFMNWVQAASNNDRRGMQRHGRSVLDTVDNMIPFMVAFEAAGKSAERLTTGKVMSRSGQLNRRLETGDFLEDPSMENFMGALGPEGLRDQDAEFPSVGTDLAPTIFGQQAIRDKLFYKWQAASSDTIDEFLYQAQQRAEELMEAIEDNDVAKVDNIAELLRVEHGIYVDPQRMLENKIYSAEISAELRTLTDRAPEAIKKKIYDQIKSHGLRLDK